MRVITKNTPIKTFKHGGGGAPGAGAGSTFAIVPSLIKILISADDIRTKINIINVKILHYTLTHPMYIILPE